MKVGNPDNSNKPLGPVVGGERVDAGKATAKPRAGEATAPAAGEPSATVDLSLSAAAIAAAGGSGADFDADKVERIAQAIRDGRYVVNAEAIADKLIANAEEVLARSKR